MKFIIATCLLVVSVNCQSPAFDSFMSRNGQLFNGVASSVPSQSFGPSQSGQWSPQLDQRSGRSHVPSVSFASQPAPSTPFVTSNSHIQAFNPPQQIQPSAGTPTTISGPNFQTSINLPALPALPQHPAGSPAALAHQQILQQQSQAQAQPQPQQFQPQPQQFQPRAQPQLTQQFTSHVHNHQFPSSQSVQPQPSSSFFNSQGNFPFNFQSASPLSLPTAPNTQATSAPQPSSFDFSGFQSGNRFFPNQPQPQVQQSAPLSAFGSSPSTTIRAPGFETTFVFVRPSEQPAQGASLSKLVKGPNGLEKQMYYIPMPNYSPPSVYNTQIVHANPSQQQQGQQQ